jgi:hypothetical protein
MQLLFRFMTSIVLSAVLISSAVMSGCAARVSTGYRVHDRYYNDDHVWDNNEITFYSRWEGETHRDHVDYRRRPAADQKEYWTWRHGQH